MTALAVLISTLISQQSLVYFREISVACCQNKSQPWKTLRLRDLGTPTSHIRLLQKLK